MHFKMLTLVGVASALISAPAVAADTACDHKASMACCEEKAGCDMPCCNKDAGIRGVAIQLTLDPLATVAEAPVRQTAEVWLRRPVWAGDTVLQGRYVIEHDNDRMARGEPCTHIYAFNDQTKPLVAFHCVHLERASGKTNTVVLESIGDGQHQKLQAFQFAGETGAHGFPTVR